MYVSRGGSSSGNAIRLALRRAAPCRCRATERKRNIVRRFDRSSLAVYERYAAQLPNFYEVFALVSLGCAEVRSPMLIRGRRRRRLTGTAMPRQGSA